MSSSQTDSRRFERRRHLRVRVYNGQLRLRLHGLEGWTARVVDISEGGLGCVFRANDSFSEPLDYALQLKDPLEILLDRGPREQELAVAAEVRSIQKRDDEPHAWSVGLSFQVQGDESARNVQSALLRLAMIRLRSSLGVNESGLRAASAASSGSNPSVSGRPRLGELLVGRGLITEQALQRALEIPSTDKIGKRLVKSGLVDGDAVAQALAVQAGVEYFDLHDTTPEHIASHLLPDTYRRRWQLLPIESNRRMVHLITASLPDPATQRLIEERCGRRAKFSIGNEQRIEDLLDQLNLKEKLHLPASSGMNLMSPLSEHGGEDDRTQAMKEMLTSHGGHLRANRPATVYQFRAGNGSNLHPTLLRGRLKTCDSHSLRIVGPVWDDRLLPADILTASPLAHLEIQLNEDPALAHIDSIVIVGRPTQITHIVGAFFLIEFLIVRMQDHHRERYLKNLLHRT